MSQRILKKIDVIILVYGLILCGGAWLFWNIEIMASVAVGAAIAVVNWIVSRWVGARLILSKKGLQIGLFLILKTALLFGGIYLVLSHTSVQPLPFIVGSSALALGVLSKGFWEGIEEGDKALREDSK